MSAAERFYSKSHELNEKLSGPRKPLSVAEVLREFALPQHRYHCVYQHFRAHPDLSAIELGFGVPEYAAAIASLTKNLHIVDVADRRGDTVLPDNLRFTRSDLNDDFPFSDSEFDCTIAMMVIEHLFDPFHSFEEIARITKPGGKVLINLPNIASIKCRLELLRGEMPVTSSSNWYEKGEWDGNHLHYFTISNTERIAKKFGLRLESIFPVGNQLWLKKMNPALFCHEISFAFSK
jgi:ubiquinone/menaquinone biosynthesis C-methylase UbiE